MSFSSSATPVPPAVLSRRVATGRSLDGIGLLHEIEERRPWGEPDDEIDLRQLRHHTKNALQRIMGLIAQAPGLHDTPQGERIAHELEQRIFLSATISNALFGLTRAPGAMADRLRSLTTSVVDLMRDPAQTIRVEVSVKGYCPAQLREAVLRVAHELVGNAVKHGMQGRPEGTIVVRLESERGRRTRLSVTDNGWGLGPSRREGEGLRLALSLAEQHDGVLRLRGDNGTVAVLDLPHSGARRRRDPG